MRTPVHAIDQRQIEDNVRRNVRKMRWIWTQRRQYPDIDDPVIVVFDVGDAIGTQVAELIRCHYDEGTFITLISAQVIARALEEYVPECSPLIRAADRSRPLAVIASCEPGVMLVYLDDIPDLH